MLDTAGRDRIGWVHPAAIWAIKRVLVYLGHKPNECVERLGVLRATLIASRCD